MPVTRLIRISSRWLTWRERPLSIATGSGSMWAGTDARRSGLEPLLGLDDCTAARAVDVAFGQHAIKLVAFDPPGRPYPAERASNDQWFQHLALVTDDINAVWEQLQVGSPGEITTGGPVLLPPNTGSVTAFKFRDPEGTRWS